MTHSGHWFKLAHYSLLLRQDGDVEKRNAQRPPPTRRLSAVFRWKQPFLLRRLACIMVPETTHRFGSIVVLQPKDSP
ncbi:MAG TPA: hypothetical protein VHC19_08845 [Pirellulales bacterium]|nr:hypothetical protein [Pirellulales bacterium]